MITLREMTVKDVPSLKLQADWMYERTENYLENGVGKAFVLEDEKGLLSAIGCAFLWPGVAEAWFNIIRKENTVTQIRMIKKEIAKQCKELEIRRLHATVRIDAEVEKRFAFSVGFNKIEGIMEQYNHDGSDVYIMAMIVKKKVNLNEKTI